MLKCRKQPTYAVFSGVVTLERHSRGTEEAQKRHRRGTEEAQKRYRTGSGLLVDSLSSVPWHKRTQLYTFIKCSSYPGNSIIPGQGQTSAALPFGCRLSV